MKGTVSAAELAAAVKTAQTIIVAGIKIDCLKYVRLTAAGGKFEIEATNLDQHMIVHLTANLSDGSAIVDPGRLLMALNPISGDVTISCTEGFMSLSGKGSRSRLALLPSELWANVERPVAETSFETKPESLKAALETVMAAVSTDPSVFFLCGCHLKWDGPDLVAEATDRFVLLSREIAARRPDSWPEGSVIVPPEFLIAAGKILAGESASLSVTASRIVLTTPAGRLASKLVAATYPDLDRVWDKKAAPALRADRKSLLAVVKLAHQFSDPNADGHRSLIIHKGEVITIGPNGEKFRAAFECKYVKDQTYSFQPRVLLAAVNALTSETIELTDGGSKESVIVIHGDGARTCVAVQMGIPAWWRREMAADTAEAA